MAKLIGLVFCIFMGITAISLGVGAAYPPINRVAQPLVCPDGEMVSSQSITNPLPGRTYIQASWVCKTASGTVQPINKFSIALYAGTFYGLILFVTFWIVISLRKTRDK